MSLIIDSRLIGIPRFFLWYLFELIAANIKMLHHIVFPSRTIRSGIYTLPIQSMSDPALLVLANAISMTPGTLVVDVDSHKTALLIHAMEPDALEDLRTKFLPRFYELILGRQGNG
jgi:multicomponent Na+:H+ antiporter subunit E